MKLRILLFTLVFSYSGMSMAADWKEWIPLVPKSLGGQKMNENYPWGTNYDDIQKLKVNYGSDESIQVELFFDPSGDMIRPRFLNNDLSPYHLEKDPNKKIGKYKFTTTVVNNEGIIEVLLHKYAYVRIATTRTDKPEQLKQLMKELPLEKMENGVK